VLFSGASLLVNCSDSTNPGENFWQPAANQQRYIPDTDCIFSLTYTYIFVDRRKTKLSFLLPAILHTILAATAFITLKSVSN